MLSRSRLFLTLFTAVCCLGGSSLAEGLAQLTLNGVIDSRGGAPVELHIGFAKGKEQRSVDLRLHLAQETSAVDVAALLVSRLRRAGAEVVFPAEHANRPGPAQIFIEDATRVSLRLGHGLWGSITIPQAAPRSVRVLTPLQERDRASLTICATTFHPHTKIPGRVLLDLEVDPKANSTTIAEALFNQGLAHEDKLVGDRPTSDRWRPVKTTAGAEITGCSIELLSPGADWGLEVELDPPSD